MSEDEATSHLRVLKTSDARADATRMDTVSPALAASSVAPAPALARPLSQDESAHLDRLREWLRGDGTDARDSSALDARWARLLETHPPHVPAPAGVAAAIGIAVGDLLVASVADAVWMMCPGPEGATPGVVLPAHPNTPVLPVLDAHARWRARAHAWTVDYVERAVAHLRSVRPHVPQPHPAPDALAADAASTPAAQGRPAPAGAAPEPALWTPRFVEADDPAPVGGPTRAEDPDAAPVVEPEVWTPTFVEDAADPAVWTPTVVEDVAPAATADVTTTSYDVPPADDDPLPVPVTSGLPTPTPVPSPSPVVSAPAHLTPALGLPVTAQQPLTPEDLPHRPSERVQDLALRALELALDRAVRDAAGSAPFVLVREGYDVEVVEYENSDAGVAQAREAAREGGYSAAAVAWTSPADASRPYPRVVVDASAAGRPGLRVAHSFAHDEHGGREIGGPQVVGQSPPVL